MLKVTVRALESVAGPCEPTRWSITFGYSREALEITNQFSPKTNAFGIKASQPFRMRMVMHP